MSKHDDDYSFTDVKRMANSSVPVVPASDRIGPVNAGNPDVLHEAADQKPSGRLRSGPAFRAGVRAGTKVQHRPNTKVYT
jgi:hypothetical protein